jgi:transposase
MSAEISLSIERYLGIDLHKHYLVIGGVNAKQEIVLSPRRIDLEDWPKWAKAHLVQSDLVVVEATTNAWDFYDVTRSFVQRVVVANAAKIALIAKTRVKTDQKDVMALARLLAAGLIPEVWVPPMEVRELRSLIAHRRRVVRTRTALKNRLQSVLHRHHLVLPSGDPFAALHRAWWDTLPVSPTERLHLKHDLATVAQLETQIAEVDDELQRLSCVAPWADRVTYLIQLPGLGLIQATPALHQTQCGASVTILSAIGDVTRFAHAKQLVGYAGLGASVHDSGQTHRTGHITKQGRKELRTALVEAAWSAVEYSAFWKAEFERLSRHLDQMKAIVAVARKLLVVVWHVLSEQAADTHANPEQVATKFMRWAWQLTEAQRGGLTTRQFIRYHLLRLQLGETLIHVRYGNMPRRIASAEEVLALKPELRPAH